MSSQDEECAICFRKYGEQPDGVFLTRDGKDNSGEAGNCKHYICHNCCYKMYTVLRKEFKEGNRDANAYCPFCRENWTLFLLGHYDTDEDDEDEENDE